MKVFLSDINSLYDRYSGRLFPYEPEDRRRSDGGRADHARHAAQVVAPKSCRAGAGATPDSASDGRIEAWLVKVCVRASIDAIRRRQDPAEAFPGKEPCGAHTRRGGDGGRLERPAGRLPERGDPEKVERIRRGMSRLPAGYRAVLSLLLFEGYDYEEAAEITGLKASSVRSQYVRAKARLLEILKKDG